MDFYKESDFLRIPPVLGIYKPKLGIYNPRLLELYKYFISAVNINIDYNNFNNITCFGTEFIINGKIKYIGNLNKIKWIKIYCSNPTLFNYIYIKINNQISSSFYYPVQNELIFIFDPPISIDKYDINFQIYVSTEDLNIYEKINYSILFSILQIFDENNTFNVQINNFNLIIDNQPPLDIINYNGIRLDEFQNQITWYNPNREESGIIIFRNENNTNLVLERRQYNLNEEINGWKVIFIGNQNDYIFKDIVQNSIYFYKIFTYDYFYNYSSGVSIII